MVKNIKIHFSGSGTDKNITIPASRFHISIKLLPKIIREALKREGIDLSPLAELPMKVRPSGNLITIETSEVRIVVSAD